MKYWEIVNISHEDGLRRPVRVVWVFRKTQWVVLFTTDLDLSVTQIIEYYSARWKIESGFKELKQEIGSRIRECCYAQAVTNHLNFCMMATTVTWIYVDRLKVNPERRHNVKGRTSFLFQMFDASLPKRLWVMIFIGFAPN